MQCIDTFLAHLSLRRILKKKEGRRELPTNYPAKKGGKEREVRERQRSGVEHRDTE